MRHVRIRIPFTSLSFVVALEEARDRPAVPWPPEANTDDAVDLAIVNCDCRRAYTLDGWRNLPVSTAGAPRQPSKRGVVRTCRCGAELPPVCAEDMEKLVLRVPRAVYRQMYG